MKLVTSLRLILAIGIAATVTCSLSGCSLLSRSTHQPYIQRATEIANALGRNANNQLAAYETCWDMGNECGYAINFTTQDSIATIESRLTTVGLSATVSAGLTISNYSVIGTLSSDPSTRSKLQQMGSTSAASSSRHESYGWMPKEKDGRITPIILYTTATWPNHFSFDGKPIVDDVVEVVVRYP